MTTTRYVGAKLKHHIPDAPASTFETLPRDDGDYFEVQIRDATSDDPPVFRARRSGRSTLLDVALKGAEECADACGVISVTEWADGVPVRSGVFVSVPRFGRQPQCRALWTTDSVPT